MTLADDDLRMRVRRLLEGGRRTEDLDRLYLGLRGRSQGCPAVQEIGDFIAHRDRREKGMITQVGRDVFTSIDVWSMTLRKLRAEIYCAPELLADPAPRAQRLRSTFRRNPR